MDVVTTSLEALMHRVTNPQNQKPDVAATEAFCVMVTKEAEGVQIGTRLLALHIQSCNESEALQALTLVDTCMRRCGPSFHAEIGKFRFLNEMIRLVSPKYLGGRTPASVRQKVLQLLHSWTKDYPQELKIKEAYEMLKKQGVVEEDSMSIINIVDDASKGKNTKSSKTKNTIFDDEEKSKLLQKLLQSKNPDDLQAANRLIKTMVREDERRVQELESVLNNAKLLSEMLDTYNRDETSAEDLELMKEVHQACEALKPMALQLAKETQHDKEMFGDVLAGIVEMGEALAKYTAIIERGETVKSKTDSNISPLLLDLSSPTESTPFDGDPVNTNHETATNMNHRSDMEVLGDIFSSIEKPGMAESASVSGASLLMSDSTIMQPITVLPTNKKGEANDTPEKKLDSKVRALEELNELGESLLKQSLSGTMSNTRMNSGSKLTAHRTLKDDCQSERYGSASSHSLLQGYSDPLDTSSTRNEKTTNDRSDAIDDPVLPMTNDPVNCSDKNAKANIVQNDRLVGNNGPATTTSTTVNTEPEIKPLADININLQDIKPADNPPIIVIEEKNGISVVLHFARDNPRPDVFVVVITTMSKNTKPLSNYLFQAVVPKRCKCRLQPPSGTDLPGHNPFLPPSIITQIMLIANPYKETVSLKFMLSYTMEDEMFTEMGEVEELPRL